MTAEEAKREARRILRRIGKGQCQAQSGIAAALIRAQVDGLEYAYLKREWEFVEARLNECRAALAELEGRDER